MSIACPKRKDRKILATPSNSFFVNFFEKLPGISKFSGSFFYYSAKKPRIPRIFHLKIRTIFRIIFLLKIYEGFSYFCRCTRMAPVQLFGRGWYDWLSKSERGGLKAKFEDLNSPELLK